MIKRSLSILLLVTMVFTMLPTAAFAATTYNIWVGGTQVTSDNASGVTGDGISGTVTYDAGTNTLTLNNTTITTYYNTSTASSLSIVGIYGQETLKIALEGTNTIDISEALPPVNAPVNAVISTSIGISSLGDIELKGSGSLKVKTGTVIQFSTAVIARNNLTITDCILEAISGTSTGTINNACFGLRGSNIFIENAIVTATGGTTSGLSAGIYGMLTIDKSTVTAIDKKNALGIGISSDRLIGVTATASHYLDGKYPIVYAVNSNNFYKWFKTEIDPNIAIINTAKMNVQDATYSNMTQAAATSQTVIVDALKATAKTAVADSSINTTINKISYTAPVAGTFANPSGKDGSYTFTVTLTKGMATQTTVQKTITITATAFTGFTDAQAVEAAKNALIDGAVNVPFGADQTAKTAAVQTYANTILSGTADATGVTATVIYNLITGKYDVSFLKGSINDTKSLTMTVIVAPDPDISTTSTAKTNAENASYSNMTQALSTDETVIEAAIKATAEAAVNNSEVTITVNYVNYIAPIAGTSENPAGTNGSYTFTITVSKGGQTESTTHKTITITATSMLTYEVSGEVKDTSDQVVDAAMVKIMLGQTQIGATANTNNQGMFSISGIPNGTYNLVISKEEIIVTKLITVYGENLVSGTIILPNGNTNSIVEVKDDTPSIVVGGLDAQFTKPQSTDDNKGITTDDINLVQDGGTVELKFTAEKKAENVAPNANDIRITAQLSNKTVGIFMDLSVRKTVTTSGGAISVTPLIELNDLIEVLIPLDETLQNKTNYIVYRYHGDSVDSITTTANADGEKIELVDNKTTIKLTVKKFSTYALAYTTDEPEIPNEPETPVSSISSPSLPTINVEQTVGGNIDISSDKKVATITPDEGYVIAGVMIDGNSVGVTEKYSFTDSKNHIITAIFLKERALPYYLQNDERIYIGFSVKAGNTYDYIALAGKTVEFKENPKNFKDNTIEWAKPSINFVTERELFIGTSQDAFSPNESMTRAMFVTVIGRLYERSYGNIEGEITFADVDTTAYYAKYVAWANENGIINGIGNNKFAPDDNITREQMGAIMLNFWNYLNKEDIKKNALAFADSASISSWAIDGAEFCQETKLIIGRNGGNFAPQESATRAEVAVVIERFIKLIME